MKTLLECKWALQILKNLAEGPKKPSELLKNIPGISNRVLYQRLKVLIDADIIFKKSTSLYPLKTYYYLNKDNKLDELISLLLKFGDKKEIYKILSSKWLISILQALKTPCTPKELLINLNGLSQKVLFENLKYLLKFGLVKREVISTIPVKVIYQLSEEGEKLLPALLKAKSIILSTQKRQNPDL
ncbi:MAG: winged helix-turn-helix transcriptional regulator [Caldimicrobium sp.]